MEIQDKSTLYRGTCVNHPLAALDSEVLRHLNYSLGHHGKTVNHSYVYRAFAIAVRDRLVDNWLKTKDRMNDLAMADSDAWQLVFLTAARISNCR